MSFLKKYLTHYNYIIYLVLFAIFPLLSFYGANIEEIRGTDFQFVGLLIINLVIAGLAWAAGLLLLRDRKKASIFAMVLLVIFFLFGRFHNLLRGVSIKTPVTLVGPTKILAVASIAVVILAWWLIRRRSKEQVEKINSTLVLVSAAVFASALISFLLASPFRQTDSDIKQSNQAADSPASTASDKPDIYYILLDAYARGDFLKEKSQFDNSEFLGFLKNKGFYVADKANSNYAHTHLSVPSTFNMKYLNYLTDEVGAESSDRGPLRDLTYNHEVANKFKSMGYKYVNVGTRWEWTLDSPQSDVTFKDKVAPDTKLFNIRLDESAVVYLQTTALKPFISTSIRGHFVNKTLAAFENTASVAEIPDPTVTFTHITSPHPPYLFDRNGVIDSQSKLELDNNGFPEREMFVDQTVYINKLTQDLIADILKKSDKPPIIIVASDHGPASGIRAREFAITDINKINVEGTRERMGILNAYLFPDQNYQELYPQITPVNSFRLILKQYFNQDIELLPDKSYLSDNGENQYRLLDITDVVKQ